MNEPTIVCVLGMHRSGTSLVTRMLNVLGVDLGPEDHLMRPSDANPTGHWESKPIAEINEEILGRLGGSWARPPALPGDWERSPELAELRRQARELIEQDFPDSQLWGFKDPRNSLTVPFWRRLLPPMRYVVCLRNPIDVALSLHAREAEPVGIRRGVELWFEYVSAALANTAGQPRHLVFYEDVMADPETVVRSLARFIRGSGPDDHEASVQDAISTALSEGLWHHRSPVSNVVDGRAVGFHVKALYLALRLFARVQPVEGETLDLFAAYAGEAGRQLAELGATRAELEGLAERLQIIERERVDLERQLSQRGAELERLAASHASEQRLREQFEAELESARDTRSTDDEAATAPAGDSDPAGEVRERVRELIPSGATVLVAAKGDESMLKLNGSRGWHFPMAADGRYAGYHPAGDTAVIAQLEALRDRGADHLLLPATTLWWLDHYEGLRRHLEDRYVELLKDEHCAIYRLRGEDRGRLEPGPITTLRRIVASLRIRTGSNPSILDLGSGLGLADRFPELPVFAPPHDDGALPYLDGTVDIVVAPGDAAGLAEARRVATSALITLNPSSPEQCALEWLAPFPAGWGEDVTVALIGGGTTPAVIETLDDGFAGELGIVGFKDELESARDATAAGVRSLEIEVERGATLGRRARAAMEVSGARVCVFLTAPAVPLPEWLPAMVALLKQEDADAGVVGPRILDPDGALAEAGGVVGSDGSYQRRGAGDSDPDRPEYRFVRRVDFCSPPLLAAKRELFERLEGFDDRHPTPAEAVIDFCLRAGQSGAPVYYQPHARVVAAVGESR